MGGASLPADTVVAFKPDGSLEYVLLPATTAIEGHRVRGHGHDWMTLFHANGRLKLCWLSEDEQIDGVP